MEYQTVGVVGAGVMGVGVAQNLAQTGHRVVLVDVSEPVLDRAKQEMKAGLRAQFFFNKKAASDPKEVMERVRFTTNDAALADADFVVENVTEKWDIKKTVYARIDTICRPDVVFAANTSAISITRIGSRPPISSASTRSSTPSRSCKRASRTTSIAPARCS